jgi:hypothetical protein
MSAPTGNVRSSAQGARPAPHNPLVTICIHSIAGACGGRCGAAGLRPLAHYTVGALAILISNNILQAKYHLFTSV